PKYVVHYIFRGLGKNSHIGAGRRLSHLSIGRRRFMPAGLLLQQAQSRADDFACSAKPPGGDLFVNESAKMLGQGNAQRVLAWHERGITCVRVFIYRTLDDEGCQPRRVVRTIRIATRHGKCAWMVSRLTWRRVWRAPEAGKNGCAGNSAGSRAGRALGR